MIKNIFLYFVLILYLCSCASQSNIEALDANYNLATMANENSDTKKNHPKPKIQGQIITITEKNSTLSKKENVVGEDAVNNANEKAIQAPSSSRYINSMMIFDYIDGALYKIYTAPLRITDIQLQEGEIINSVGAGDSLRWQVSKTFSGSGIARTEHLLVKPVEEDLVNSLVITTDRRTYHLILQSKPNTYMASVIWHYTDNDMVKKYNHPENDVPFNAGLDINLLDFRYQIKLTYGSKPDWYPTMIFNDGRKTYIRLSPGIQEAPVLFVGSDSKNNQMINYRIQGNYYIIDGIFPRIQLRSGQSKPTIVQINHAS